MHLALQKPVGNGRFFCHPDGVEHIKIATLVLGKGNVFYLHNTLSHQRFLAVIQHTDAAPPQLLSQFALGEVGTFLQHAYQPETKCLLGV